MYERTSRRLRSTEVFHRGNDPAARPHPYPALPIYEDPLVLMLGVTSLVLGLISMVTTKRGPAKWGIGIGIFAFVGHVAQLTEEAGSL